MVHRVSVMNDFIMLLDRMNMLNLGEYPYDIVSSWMLLTDSALIWSIRAHLDMTTLHENTRIVGQMWKYWK